MYQLRIYTLRTAEALERGLIERNAHQLLVSTRAFLDHVGLRDLADLPPLVGSSNGEFSDATPRPQPQSLKAAVHANPETGERPCHTPTNR